MGGMRSPFELMDQMEREMMGHFSGPRGQGMGRDMFDDFFE